MSDTARSEHGFTLAEVLVVVAIIGLGIGLLVPLVDNYVTATQRSETRSEMKQLADGVLDYYRDVGAAPELLQDLLVWPLGVEGWNGPYVESRFRGAGDVRDDHRFDRWLEPYVIDTGVGTSTFVIRSTGPDRIDEFGAGDDLQVEVNLALVMRDVTERELLTLNDAVDLYNEGYLPDEPLSSNLPVLLGQLQARGFLPLDSQLIVEYSKDQWGNDYVAVGEPVVDLVSNGSM